jgi:hypothetical protein
VKSVHTVRRAQVLVEAGWTLLAVANELGVSRAALRDWRDQGFDHVIADRQHRYPGQGVSGNVVSPGSCTCDAIDRASRRPATYAYVFGQYLGDGSIQRNKNGVPKLRIFCCSDYPGIIGRVVASARAIVPGRVSGWKSNRARLVVVTTHWKHLPCLFPQDGPGRKHDRFICLADWQNEIVVRHPEPFLRGLIESDGCRDVNRVNGGEYPRYSFCNVSDDIRRLCTRTLDLLDVHWTQMNANNIAVARRPDVAYLDSFIGPKW